MKHLACLVADKNMEAAMLGLLERHQALGLRSITYDVYVHPRRDPGVFHEGVAFLRPLQRQYQHGLLVPDAAWEGAPQDIQGQLDDSLRRTSLDRWARAIVIVPELEVWVWSRSPHVETALGWAGRNPPHWVWLRQRGLWADDDPKPRNPKEAVEESLEQVGKPRSSAIYRNIARTVSVERCTDTAFQGLRQALQEWFGIA